MPGCFINILPNWFSSSSKRRRIIQQESPLLNIPLDAANKVLEKLEPMDLYCRNVCLGLRHAVDGFGIHVNTVGFRIYDRGIRISYDYNTTDYSQQINDKGLSMTYKKLERTYKKQNYVKLALKDFGILLRYASELKISAPHKCYTNKNLKLLLKTWKAKKWNHVKKLEFSRVHLDFILSIFPHFNSQGLESITMRNIYLDDQFEQITQLDQWKNTKNFCFDNYELECPPFEHLFHFQTFEIHILNFSIENAIQFRDDLLKRKTFESCTVRFGGTTEFITGLIQTEVARVFKSDYVYSSEEYEYSNDMNKFTIKCHYGQLFIKRC
ncbi:DUF38 domain-containing protein [Caenorhabditis elegans]|uniref:DUF38 domain-containing protein n=1 Tax=Caenorhabditis elegans TaxID=6239 RepID=Q95XB5_CAEEL|nr:DUF38 domain-containing protein [Caenorhabditis elegans]CCD73902.1 DUF38 domain-containing protein [Caenorhabditis elegans]|eukprot:NP_497387.2 F-box A protein [Caenorhabditis elegans]